MLRFIVLLPLTTFFFGLSLVMILMGHQQPPSTWAQILHLSECEPPCWIGIVPDQTTLVEAQKRIAEVYGDTDINQALVGGALTSGYFRMSHKATGESLRIAFGYNNVRATQNPIITQIYFELSLDQNSLNKRPTIPDLYEDLGKPEIVRLATGVEKESIAIFTKAQRVQIFLDDLECDKLYINQEILQIVFVESVPSAGWLSDPQQWRGFGRCYHLERKLFP